MAEELAEKLPQNSESTMCMRKLLEARDCAMRSAFFEEYRNDLLRRSGLRAEAKRRRE